MSSSSNASANATATATASFPIFGILGIVFVTLKLMGITAVATWSWWLVLLPFYGPWVLLIGFLFLIIVMIAIAS